MQSYHLCQLAGEYRGQIPIGGMLFEQKIDGWRGLWLRDHTGKPGLWTRNGHPIEGTGHIAWHLSQIERAAGQPLVIDGEFQVAGTLAATKEWGERGWKHGGEAGEYFAFDCLTLAEWQDGGTDQPLVDRKADLARWANEATGDGWEWRPGSHGRDDGACPVSVLPDGWAFDTQDVEREARRVWAAGGEGLMLKDPESPYQRNRNNHWIKVKQGQRWQRAA